MSTVKKLCDYSIFGCMNSVSTGQKSCPTCTDKYKYLEYKIGSEKRNIQFELSISDFNDIISTECYYCGKFNDDSLNNVNRLNNDVGYTLENSVACCHICNIMKWKYSFVQFMTFCGNIFYAGEVNEYFIYTEKINSLMYKDFLRKTKQKKQLCSIKKEQYSDLIRKKCKLCDSQNDRTYIGIERINNNDGFNIENVFSCCPVCYQMKQDINLLDFVTKIEHIMEKYMSIYVDNNQRSYKKVTNVVVQYDPTINKLFDYHNIDNYYEQIKDDVEIISVQTTTPKIKSRKEPKIKSNKCGWYCGTTRRPCPNNISNVETYCEEHSYVLKYSPDEIANTKLCKNCGKIKFIEQYAVRCVDCKISNIEKLTLAGYSYCSVCCEKCSKNDKVGLVIICKKCCDAKGGN